MCNEADQRFSNDKISFARRDGDGLVLLLDSQYIAKIAAIIRGPYTALFMGILKANKQLRAEVSTYLVKANIRRTQELKVSAIWFEDLGHFLIMLGQTGRLHLTNLSFEWDNKERITREKLGPSLWREKNGPAKIFKLLATCENLRNLNIRFDGWRLLYAKPDGSCLSDTETNTVQADPLALYNVPGMTELRNVKVQGTVKLGYNYWSVSAIGWNQSLEFLAWLEAGMTDLKNKDSVMDHDDRVNNDAAIIEEEYYASYDTLQYSSMKRRGTCE